MAPPGPSVIKCGSVCKIQCSGVAIAASVLKIAHLIMESPRRGPSTLGAATSAGRRRDHPQMTSPAHLSVDGGDLLRPRGGSRRLADRLGQRDQIVNAVRGRVKLTVVPDQIPASGRGQAACVLLAKIIGVRLGEGGERSDDGGRFRIHIRQRRDRQSGAAVARTTPWGPHRRTVSPPESNR